MIVIPNRQPMIVSAIQLKLAVTAKPTASENVLPKPALTQAITYP